MKKLPIKFRGVPLPCENYWLNSKPKNYPYVFGGYYQDKNGVEYIITPNEMIKCNRIGQLVGYDCTGEEVFSGDVLVDERGRKYVASRLCNVRQIDQLRLLRREADR